MSKPRTCPHCNIEIPIDHGFHFDDQLNLIHDNCDKIVFSTNIAGDNAISMINRMQRSTPAYQSPFSSKLNGDGNGNGYDMDV